MLRVCVAAGLLALFVAADGLIGQDKKAGGDDAPKVKARLPIYWSKLGLSDEQKDQAMKTINQYRGKIEKLKQDIETLEEKQKTELAEILTDVQKDRLRKLIAKRVGDVPAKEKDKKREKGTDK